MPNKIQLPQYCSLFQQEVSEAAEEQRSAIMSHDLGVNFDQLKAQYGQTSAEHSLYKLFESFKETALQQNS